MTIEESLMRYILLLPILLVLVGLILSIEDYFRVSLFESFILTLTLLLYFLTYFGALRRNLSKSGNFLFGIFIGVGLLMLMLMFKLFNFDYYYIPILILLFGFILSDILFREKNKIRKEEGENEEKGKEKI